MKEDFAKIRWIETLLRASADGIVITDPANNIIFVNDIFCKFFSRNRQDMIKTDFFVWLAKLGPNARDIWKGLENQINEHGIAKDVEFAMKTGEGMRYYSVNSSLLEKIDTEETGLIISIWRDDTQSKMAQEALKRAHDELEMRVKERTELRENEAKLSQAQRIAHIGSWVYDVKGRISWSDETYRIYGVSPDTFTPNAESFINLIHPDDRAAMQAWINTCLAGEKPGKLEFRSIIPDGTVHFISGRGEMKYDAENRPIYMTGTAQDITERKRAEDMLKLHEIRLQDMLELHRLAGATEKEIFDFTLEISLRAVESEFAFIGLMNVDETVMISPAWSKKVMLQCQISKKLVEYPLSQAGLWGEVVRQRRPIIVNDYEISKELKKGYPQDHIPIKRLLGIPIISGSRIVAVACAANKASDYTESDVRAFKSLIHEMWNILEHRRKEEEVSKNRAMLLKAQEIGHVGSWEWNIATNDVVWTKEIYNIYGLDPKNVKPNYELILSAMTPESKAEFLKAIDDALKLGENFDMEYCLIRPDGARAYVHTKGEVMFDSESHPLTMFGMVQDITQRKRAEEALRESENAYHTLAENLPGIVYRVFIRENNRMRFFNKLADKVTGYKDEELTAGEVCSIENLIVPEDREMVIAEVKRAITKNISFTVEYRLKHKDGSTRCMLERGTPIYGKEGQPLYIDGIIFDVTERKKVEEELRRSQASLESAQAQAKLGNWDLDPTTQKGHWSKEMYRLLDIDPSTDPPHYSEFLELIHPEDRQRVQNNHKEAFKGEHPIITEFRGNPARGLNRYFLGTVHRKRNDKGMGTQLFGTLLDITERKQIEEELRKSEELFRKLIEAEPECVKLVSKENILVDMNPAGLRMIEADSCEQVIGKSVLGIIDPEYRNAFAGLVERVFNGESVILEFSITGLKGTKRWLETHAVPLRDDNGKINLLISVTRDITEHKRAEEERIAFVSREQAALAEAEAARKLDRMKSMFIAATSHELRTPLNSIIGFTSLILGGNSGELNPDQKEQLMIVHSSGKHLLSLINDILDLSMIESGNVILEVSTFNLRKIVDEAVTNLNVLLNEKNLRLKVDVGDIIMKSDRLRILQSLINLLSNAVKYTEKGSIEITARVIDNNVELSVIDTGIGIKTEDIPKLFSPFVRLQSPLTLRTSGTGLGLYLVKKLAIDFLGGDMEVKSEFGKGSTFTLRVPVELEGKA